MNLTDVTPLVITYNEEANIARTLAAISWAQRIVVVDSGSTDKTLAILQAAPNVEVHTRPFDNFASQCGFGLAFIQTAYALSLDADHVMTPELVKEIAGIDPQDVAGWEAPFTYCIDGRPLRASLLPPRLVLFRTTSGAYENDGHAHRAVVSGRTERLRNPLRHDDRKPLSRWLAAQSKYLRQEAEKLTTTSWSALRWPDRLRRLYLGPLLVLPYCLLVKGLLLDGRRGIYYSLQRLYAEGLLALRLAGGGGKKKSAVNL